MSRHARLRLADVPFHVIQRGNNRGDCFFRSVDYRFYLACLGELAVDQRVAVHAYVLMRDHVHIVMTPRDVDGVPRLMKFLGQRYVQYVNRAHGRTGTLWDGRYRSCLVHAESWLMNCQHYVETNPVRAGISPHPRDYAWSSYRANAEGAFDAVITPHPVVHALGATLPQRCIAYRQWFERATPRDAPATIRACTRAGYTLGPEAFQHQVATLLARRGVCPPPAF